MAESAEGTTTEEHDDWVQEQEEGDALALAAAHEDEFSERGVYVRTGMGSPSGAFFTPSWRPPRLSRLDAEVENLQFIASAIGGEELGRRLLEREQRARRFRSPQPSQLTPPSRGYTPSDSSASSSGREVVPSPNRRQMRENLALLRQRVDRAMGRPDRAALALHGARVLDRYRGVDSSSSDSSFSRLMRQYENDKTMDVTWRVQDLSGAEALTEPPTLTLSPGLSPIKPVAAAMEPRLDLSSAGRLDPEAERLRMGIMAGMHEADAGVGRRIPLIRELPVEVEATQIEPGSEPIRVSQKRRQGPTFVQDVNAPLGADVPPEARPYVKQVKAPM